MGTSVFPTQSFVDAATAYRGSSTIYFELATAVPSTSAATRGDCTLVASGAGYSPFTLSNVTISADGNGAKITTTDTVIWNNLYTDGTTIHGICAFLRAGGSPASGDKLMGFIRRIEALSIANVSTTNDSPVITVASGFSALTEDWAVSGTGIPTNTNILNINSDTSITLDREATATGTITLTVNKPNPFTPPTTSGNAVNLSFTVPSIGFWRIGA